MNLSNLSISTCADLKFYASAGANVMSVVEKVEPLCLTCWNGDLSMLFLISMIILILIYHPSVSASSLGGSANIATHMLFNLGLNYRFSSKEESVEWNNPLDAMYGDIANVKTEIEGLSTDSDGDGVSDAFDADNNTPEGVAVDGKGNALDVDMDGVADYAR